MVEDINQMSGFFAIKVIIGGIDLIAAGGSQYCLAGRKQAGFTAVFFYAYKYDDYKGYTFLPRFGWEALFKKQKTA